MVLRQVYRPATQVAGNPKTIADTSTVPKLVRRGLRHTTWR